MVACYQRHSIWMEPPQLTKEKRGDSFTALPESDSSAYLRRWPRPMRLARSERAGMLREPAVCSQ